MTDITWIDNPEQTPGLSSALQLINTTDAISFSSDTTSSTFLEPVIIFPAVKTEEQIPTRLQKPKPYITRRQKFRKALEESLEQNRDILDELAKY